MKSSFFSWCLLLLSVVAGLRPAQAHPMGNFSINHYARFQARPDDLALRYILDFAEVPTAQRMPQLDTNGDGDASEAEKRAFVQREIASLRAGLKLTVDDQPAQLRALNSHLDLRPGAGGLDTLRIIIEFVIPMPRGEHRIAYQDDNFQGRTGWMEIIALPSPHRAIFNSDAQKADRSQGLTIFPQDNNTVPPHQDAATFSIAADGVATGSNSQQAQIEREPEVAASSQSETPQNRFTQTIAERQLTPTLILSGLLIALAFGAVHALSPGHGKTMVAAYLVGSRGTSRHAVLLGLVVTITHTLGVFALGFVTLFATRYILPERLYPALSGASGLLIFGVGLWLLMSRLQTLSHSAHGHHHHHGHDHPHDHEHPHDHAHEDGTGLHVHSHGGRAHSHGVPDGPVTARTLVLLGISGGIVPCPEALVVLLAAIKMHRIAYGMLLITAFSVGLAAALIAIGLAVVSAHTRLSRFNFLAEGGVLTRYLPIGSAAIITLIGVALTMRAVGGTP